MWGKKLIRPLVLGSLALATLAAAGCAGEALRFNNAIAEYNKRLNTAGKRLGEAIKPVVQGGKADPGQVKSAYDETVTALNDVKRDFAALKVPSSPGAQQLADAYKVFLNGQESMIRGPMAQIVTSVQGGRADRNQIVGALMQIGQREQQDLAQLQAAQRQFATQNNIKLQ